MLIVMSPTYRRCLPVWWSVRRGGHTESQCHQYLCCIVGTKAVGSVVQLRSCFASVRAAGVEGQSGEHRGSSGGIRQEIDGTTFLAVLC